MLLNNRSRYLRTSSASFSFIFYLFQTRISILIQINVKNVHPVYVAGIRTHDLQNMSLLQNQ